jgi:hypothetical protein
MPYKNCKTNPNPNLTLVPPTTAYHRLPPPTTAYQRLASYSTAKLSIAPGYRQATPVYASSTCSLHWVTFPLIIRWRLWNGSTLVDALELCVWPLGGCRVLFVWVTSTK